VIYLPGFVAKLEQEPFDEAQDRRQLLRDDARAKNNAR